MSAKNNKIEFKKSSAPQERLNKDLIDKVANSVRENNQEIFKLIEVLAKR